VDRDFAFQVLLLFRRGGATQHLVAVWVASEAGYHVAVSSGLVEIGLVPPPEVGWGLSQFLLAVAYALLLKGEVLSRKVSASVS